jgi:hypothetical protein
MLARSALLFDLPDPLLQLGAPWRMVRGLGFASGQGLPRRRGRSIQSRREVEQIDVGVFSRNDCREIDQRPVGARPRWLVVARFGAPPRESHLQRIVMIARSANDRGANQLITATFTLHNC